MCPNTGSTVCFRTRSRGVVGEDRREFQLAADEFTNEVGRVVGRRQIEHRRREQPPLLPGGHLAELWLQIDRILG